MICAAPCAEAFSAFQISSRSACSRAELAELFVERLQALLRGFVAFLLERLALHLELHDAPVEPVDLLGLGVDFHADARRRLVDQVDGLVGQLPVRDVAVRQRRGGHDGRVGDLDLVVNGVALLQPAQDGDRVLHGGLAHQHLLEAALERRVLLDVLAVLVERRRAHAMQLTACERGLQHVAGVHRALGLAGADHGVQLVDEQDHAAFLLREVVQHAFQSLFELAAKLGARDQRAHVEREDALVLEPLGDFAVDDALRESLDDRGLADSGLADQHGIVLGASLQHLDGAADLVVAADHRVELALLGPLGQVDRVLLQRLPLLLGVCVGDLLAAAHFVDRALDRALHDTAVPQDLAERPLVLERRKHEQLARDVLVAALLRELVGQVQHLAEVVRKMNLAAGAFHLREVVERLAELRAQPVDVGTGLVEQRAHRAALLVEQRQHQVRGLDELVVAAERQRLGIGEGHLELAGQFVGSHEVRAPERGCVTALSGGGLRKIKPGARPIWVTTAQSDSVGLGRARPAPSCPDAERHCACCKCSI